MRAPLGLVLALSVLLASSVARADDDDVPPRDPPRSTHVWYGYQTLAADGVALALFLPAVQPGGTQQGLSAMSLVTYSLGAPILHLVHGQADKAFGDVALRVVLPLVTGVLGGFAGAANAAARPPTCSGASLGCAFDAIGAIDDGVAVGGMLGMAGAAIIDASVLAREHVDHYDVVAGARPWSGSPPSSAKIEPTFGVTPERQGGARATLGVVGAF